MFLDRIKKSNDYESTLPKLLVPMCEFFVTFAIWTVASVWLFEFSPFICIPLGLGYVASTVGLYKLQPWGHRLALVVLAATVALAVREILRDPEDWVGYAFYSVPFLICALYLVRIRDRFSDSPEESDPPVEA